LNMRLRRAELNFNGALSDTTRWAVGVDFARAFGTNTNGTNILNDVVISQTLVMPELTLDVGQFKIPTVAESLDPSGQLLFPERSMVARTWGESRQPGARIAYATNMWKLQGMISNGGNTKGNNIANNGQNTYDTASTATNAGTVDAHPNNKDLTFRFDIKPMDMVSAGAFAYLPNYNWGQGGAFGGNVRLMPMEDLVVRAEYVRGWVRGAGTDNLPHNGYVIDGGYQYGDFQPVARYEIQQQCVVPTGAGVGGNSTASGDCFTASATTIGLNYYLMKHNSKVQFAYTFLGKNTSGSNAANNSGAFSPATGSYSPQPGTGGTVATLALQVAI
ncbi:MAG: porin, partial [Bdellovibrionia bacterium]